jgi:hypothetical protein
MVVVAILVVVADGGTPGGRFLKTAYCFLTGGGGGPNVGRFRRFSRFLSASTPFVCSLQKKSSACRQSPFN